MAQLSLISGTELLEERTFLWKISNFYSLYETAKSSGDENSKKFAKSEFTVGGKSTGIPTKWQFYLKPNGNSHVSIYLELLGTGCYSAEYEVQLTNLQDNQRYACVVRPPKHRYAKSVEGAVSESGCHLGSLFDLQNCCTGQPPQLELVLKLAVFYPSEINLKGGLSNDFKKALDSGIGADFNFIFTEEGSGKVIEKIPAHRTILSIRSPVFATMFASGMVEATKGEVEISGVTPKAIKILLRFIYTGEVDSAWVDVPDELLCTADLYQLDQLKNFLCENITVALTLGNVMKIRNLGELYNLPEVVEAAMKFMQDNFQQIFQNYDLVLKNPLSN